jgi:pimeloyl-ACP methyl ester carboxylesterase
MQPFAASPADFRQSHQVVSKEIVMTSSATRLPTAEGPGSVSGAPNLPAGFGRTFTSRYVDAGGLRQHVVLGGSGPPLLLVHGWPENWYMWRLVMPALAKDFQVIAPDQRGIGLTDKPQHRYDPGTLANDLVALMDALGHQRFAVVGTDTGLPISYALAVDHPDRVERVALAEVPGPPGVVPQAPLFPPKQLNNKLWHIAVNRLDNLNEQLAKGREDIYFGYEFNIQAAKKLPANVIDYYVDLLTNPDSLRGTFAFFREWDTMMAQNDKRKDRLLTLPVLGIGGEASPGADVGSALKGLANDVQSAVIPGAGPLFRGGGPRGDGGCTDTVPGSVPRASSGRGVLVDAL